MTGVQQQICDAEKARADMESELKEELQKRKQQCLELARQVETSQRERSQAAGETAEVRKELQSALEREQSHHVTSGTEHAKLAAALATVRGRTSCRRFYVYIVLTVCVFASHGSKCSESAMILDSPRHCLKL